MIEIKDLSKSYKGEKILENVSMTIEDGATLMLCGASGRGKTTLLRIIMGLERPDSGELIGVPERISAVFQEDRLPGELTPVVCVKMTSDASRSEICAHLAEVGLAGHENKRMKELSGGMKRRVAIVRAMLHESELIIMDEPFNGLDAETKKLVSDYIKKHRGGRTLILVSHTPGDAEHLCGNAVILKLP